MYQKEVELEALERVLLDASADPIKLSHNLLEDITKNFSEVIGSGGFGEVYKGFIKDMNVAVKKLFRTGDFSDVQFGNELQCLTRVKHKNIVRCLGYCADTTKELVEHKGKFVLAEVRRRFLCFEYIPKQSLHDYLNDKNRRCKREIRFELIVGICQGLQYLHNEEHINHLDLTPANILLDANMVPKITDFGLSIRFSGAQSRKITETFCGTMGYVAPELWNRGEISFKSDIFSLGVIIRNILKGSNDLSNFESWDKSLEVDPQLKRCIDVAQLCADYDQHKRPTINSVIEMLDVKKSEVQMVSPILCQSSNKNSSVQQASTSSAKLLVGKVQSMTLSAEAYHSQLQRIANNESKGPREASSTEASNLISKAAEGVVSVAVYAAPSSQQQQPQIFSVLRGLGEKSIVGNGFVHNLVGQEQSTSDSGQSSLQEITTIPKRYGEASIIEANSSSVCMSACDVQSEAIFPTASSPQQEQQQQQITSVLGEPEGGQRVEGNSFFHGLLIDDVESIIASAPSSPLQQIPDVCKGPGETSTEISKLLDVYPLQLYFPFEPNKLIRCAVTLTNRTEYYVGVWITLTYPDTRLGFGFPVTCGNESFEDMSSCFYETMDPHSTLAVPVTMKELQGLPRWDIGKFSVLMIVVRQKEHIEKLMKASNVESDLLNRALELEATVNRVILTASICDPTCCQAVIANYKFMPKQTSFCDIEVITDVHPTKTWFLARQKGGSVSIWDYETKEKMMVVEVTKVPTRPFIGLKGIQKDQRGLGGIKSPISQNPSQSSPIPLNSLGERINQTRPQVIGPSYEPQIHVRKNLIQQPRTVDASLQYHYFTHSFGVKEEDPLVNGARFRDPGYNLPPNLYPQYEAGPVVGGIGRVEGVGSEVLSTTRRGQNWGVSAASGGRIEVARPGYVQGVQVPKTTGKWQSRGRGVESGIFAQGRIHAAKNGHWRRGKDVRERYGQRGESSRMTFAGTSGGHGWGGGRGDRRNQHDSSRARSVHPSDNCLDVRSAKFISREHWLVAGDDDGSVHVYTYTTKDKIKEFIAHHDRHAVDMLSVHPTCQFLLTASSFVGTSIKLWDWSQGWICTRTINMPSTRLLHLRWNPRDTNGFASVSNSYNNTLKLWKIDSSDPVTTMEGMKMASYLCNDTQWHTMVTTNHLQTRDKKRALIWNLQTKECVHRLGLSGWDMYDIACHPTLPILATSHSDGSIICLWDTRAYRIEAIIELQDGHIPGMIFFSSTEDITRLVIKCWHGVSTMAINLPTPETDQGTCG